ncbi:hypothetical protein OF83DRAFT_525622 [Amylostereum chailletii]|nr:hypothetical protein OF83DRAFT_525622 [Amylostereum chailletii]
MSFIILAARTTRLHTATSISSYSNPLTFLADRGGIYLLKSPNIVNCELSRRTGDIIPFLKPILRSHSAIQEHVSHLHSKCTGYPCLRRCNASCPANSQYCCMRATARQLRSSSRVTALISCVRCRGSLHNCHLYSLDGGSATTGTGPPFPCTICVVPGTQISQTPRIPGLTSVCADREPRRRPVGRRDNNYGMFSRGI